MSAMIVTLAELLDPVELRTFWGEYWEQQLLHVSRPGYDYSGLISTNDLDALLAYNNSPSIPTYAVARNGPLAPQMNSATQVQAFDDYCQGKTIFIASIHQRWQPISLLCRGIEEELRHPVGATLVLSPKGEQGLPPHYDSPDVIAMQLEGEKTWEVFTPLQHLPINGCSYLEGVDLESLPSQQIQMRAGDLLYIPRGFPHRAYTSDQTSLHLSMYIDVIRWRDLLIQMVNDASERHLELRQGLPVGLLASGRDITPVKQVARRLLKLLLEDPQTDAALERLGGTLIESMRPLPDGHFMQLNGLDNLALDTRVLRRPGMLCQVYTQTDSAEIKFPGSNLQGPPYLTEAFKFIARVESFIISELPGLPDGNSQMVLVRRLIREGLLRRT